MDKEKSLRISFCTTCKNRGHHLAETLPKNLEATKDYPNAEFVILDYGDDNGIEGKTIKEWLIEKFPEEIASGRIRYARTEQEHFKMAHAKNMAHRLGTGDVLVNLDADNVMGAGFAEQSNTILLKHPKSILRFTTLQRISLTLQGRPSRGTGGRIAIPTEFFYKINGYDEAERNSWGDDDKDLIGRGIAEGLIPRQLRAFLLGNALEHSDLVRVENMSPQDSATSSRRLKKRANTQTIISHILTENKPRNSHANPDGDFGCGEVTLLNCDFSETKRNLETQVHPQWQEKPSPNMGEKFWSYQMDAELNSGYHSRG